MSLHGKFFKFLNFHSNVKLIDVGCFILKILSVKITLFNRNLLMLASGSSAFRFEYCLILVRQILVLERYNYYCFG